MSNRNTNDRSHSGVHDSRASVFTLLWAVLYKRFVIMFRYRVNLLGQIVTIYIFFAMIFFGGQAAISGVGGDSLGSTFDSLIVGWFLWTMAQGAYEGLSSNVTLESQWGTLEQLYMSPYGFGTVIIAKVIANLIQSLAIGGVILALMLVTTQRSLSVDVVTILPISILALMSVIGLGFVFAGLAVIYKRIGSLANVMQFVLVGFIAAPVAEFPPIRLLPLAQGSAMLQEAMRDGVRLWEFSTLDIAVLGITAVVYSIVGYIVFQVCARTARKRGVMGHY